MKRSFIFIFIAVFLISMASCSLFQKPPTANETTEFVDEIDAMANDPSSTLDGENSQLVAAASSDFFTKGGTAIDYMIPFAFTKKDFNSKLLIDSVYGTYTYNDSLYDFELTDGTTPANGYLYKWTFVDTAGTSHNAELLFDSITYYSGDPNKEVPTNLFIMLTIDGTDLLKVHYEATYQTINNDGYDEYLPITMTASLEIVDEAKITISYTGEIVQDSTGADELQINSASLRLDDLLKDEWVLYTVTSTGEKTINFTMENNEGWKLDIDTAEPVEVTDNNMVYTRIDLTGEITKNGIHAADAKGIIWSPEDLGHQSYLQAIFPDGSTKDIDLNIPF